MATQRIITTFQFKRSESIKWSSVNPVLEAGEPGYETDTGKLKIGNGVNHWNNLPYINDNSEQECYPILLNQVKDYLFNVYYSNIDYDNAYEYFEQHTPNLPFACTAVRKGSYFGRNLDWLYNENAEFVVNIPRTADHYASIGIAGGIPGLTNSFVKFTKKDKLYKLIPFFTLDGINEYGLVISTNVVPADKGLNTYTIPEIEEKVKINNLMLPRYILDHFFCAEDAVAFLRNYVNLYPSATLSEYEYEVHYLISDGNSNYLIEIINNKFVITDLNEDSNSVLAGKPYITNFFLSDVALNADGSVYTPYTRDEDHDAIQTNNITPMGSGLERYNLIANRYAAIENEEDITNLMKDLRYTNTYRYSETAPQDYWYTEFVGGSDPVTPEQRLTVASNYVHFEPIAEAEEYIFKHRSRLPESEYFGTWHSTHTAIYNINNLSLSLYTQEEDEEIEYILKATHVEDETLVIF